MPRPLEPDDRRGWTKTPNRLLDEQALAGASLPARHRAVLDWIVRQTLGWRATSIRVSQVRIARGVGSSARSVREVLVDLERWRVVERREAARGRVAWLAVLEPSGWRISRTLGAILRAERRRIARGGDQPLLPFPDVARVLSIPTRARVPTPVGVRKEDTKEDLLLSRVRALTTLRKRKKTGQCVAAERRGKVGSTLSRRVDRMPNDPPQPSPEERARFRARRAAKYQIRRTTGRNVWTDWDADPELVALAESMSVEEVERELAAHDEETATRARRDRDRRQNEAMRHEGRGW